MRDKLKIGITFAIFNNIKFTKKYLTSLFSNKSKHNLHVIIVDNGSTDNSQEIIKKEFPQAHIISNKENMGCAIAWNQGLQNCVDEGCDYFVLSQNDITISSGTIDKCVDFLEENKNFEIISPVFINSPWHSDINLTQKQLDIVATQCQKKFGGGMDWSFSFYFFMMRPSVFQKVQFDERFRKVFFEDYDFYNSIYLNRIVGTQSVDIGVGMHKFSATVAIAGKNLGLNENKKIFQEKWKDKEDMINEGRKFVNSFLTVKARYKRKHLGLDIEGENLYPVREEEE